MIPSELISISVQLAIEASKLISSIQKSALTNYSLKGFKDPLTQADLTSQLLIIKGLKKFWPNATIIGEEDQLPEKEWKFNFNNLNKKLISDSYFYPSKAYERLQFSIKDSIIWIDPLDGTLDYIKNDLEAVTTLIGVSYKNHPVIGVIGHPNSEKVYFSYAATKKLFVLPFDLSTPPQELKVKEKQNRPYTLCVTKYRMNYQLQQDLKKLGGCGRKILSVIFNESDAYYSNSINKIKKWDICAGEAMLNAIGGKLTDLNGNQYQYLKSEIENPKGILAVRQQKIAKKILKKLEKSNKNPAIYF